MIMQAHMNKVRVPGTRNCFRGVADNGMSIEMLLAGDGTNIADVITAYPIYANH